MKKIIVSLLFSLIASAIITLSFDLYTAQKSFDDTLYGNIIRFHIISNSDSFEDTRAKLLIKDKITDYLYSMTKDCESCRQAEKTVRDNLSGICNKTKSISEKLGYDYEIAVSLSEEKYPVRLYDDFALPAGSYTSLKIELGQAKGKNWWCVVYPAICRCTSGEIDDGLKKAGVAARCSNEIKNKNAKYKFYILELFK